MLGRNWSTYLNIGSWSIADDMPPWPDTRCECLVWRLCVRLCVRVFSVYISDYIFTACDRVFVYTFCVL